MRFIQITLASLATILVSSMPLPPAQGPQSAINSQLNINSIFQHCDAKQEQYLSTVTEDIHRLAVLSQHAAQLISTGEARSLELFDKHTNLTQDTAKTLLSRWLGSGNMTAMAEAVTGVFGEIDAILVTGNATFRFDCMGSVSACNANANITRNGYIFKAPLGEVGSPWWIEQSITLCPKFWQRPTLEETLHSKDIRGDDVKPASYSLMDELIQFVVDEHIETLDPIFVGCEDLLDGQLPTGHENAFLTAQKWANLCNQYAIRQYDTWPGFALEVAEAAFKGKGHLPRSAYENEETE